jgi:hypothetical protein
MTNPTITLYCPKCLERLKFDANSLTPSLKVACDFCRAVLVAGELVTSTGAKFARYALHHARLAFRPRGTRSAKVGSGMTSIKLVPSEQAVLKQIRMLLLESSTRTRTYPVTLLRSRWPALHSEAYNGGYLGLIKRGFIATSADDQIFSITNAGLAAMTKAS